MILWRISLRELRSRPGRALLTLFSIVLGVASVVAVTLATGAARTAYKDLFSAVAGKSDLAVTSEGTDGFSQEYVAELDKVEGFAAVVPSLTKPVRMYGQSRSGKDIRATLQAMGVDPQRDKAVREYELVEGEYFSGNREAVLDADFAKSVDVTVGDKIRLGDRDRREYEIKGLIKLRGAAGLTHAGIIFIPLNESQKLFGMRGKVDAIHLIFEPKIAAEDRHKIQEAAANVLAADLSIAPPASGSQLAEESMLSPETGLFIASTMSLVVAAFIILNTFFINVSERRRQLAILRAIGTTRWQIMRLLMNEGLLLGIVGTLLGMAVGVVGAYFLTRAMEGLFQTALPAVQFSIVPFGLAALFGIGISLIATFIPAWSAGQVSPLEGMGGMVRTEVSAKTGRVLGIGLFLFILGGVLMALAVSNVIPDGVLNVVGFLFRLFGAAETVAPDIVISLAGTVTQLLGFIFIVHWALKLPVGVASAVLSPFMRVETRLARQQLLRRRTRTTLTIGILFMAVSTGIGMGSTLLDNVQDVQNWYRRTIIGDFFVRSMMPDMTGDTSDVPDKVREEIEKIPGIKRIGAGKFSRGRAAGHQVLIVSREFGLHDEAKLDLKDIDPKKAKERLLAGEVVISTVLSERTNLKTGDEITVDAVGGPRQFKIAGMANEYIVSGLVLYMDRATAQEALGISGASAYVIDAEKEHYADVEAALQEICREHGILLQSQAQINGMIDGMMSGVIACQWAILLLGFFVSGFGIVNTLTMNVLEQTRELGLLRTVAMTRWQVRKLIFSQASIIGVISLFPGVALGLGMAWFINISTLAVTGHPVEFGFRPLLLLGAFFLGFFIVLLAAWFPAERAARLDLTTALNYE